MRGEALRRALARALGDQSLEIAYAPAASRRPARAAPRTPVERDGRLVATLVYDAALDDDPELVEAVGAAAAIALENERLHAESEARLEELRASRERLVAAGDEERRRLERNLHDGAQQRLVALSLQLRMIQGRIRARPVGGRAPRRRRQRRARAVALGAARARARHPSRRAQPRPARGAGGARRPLAGPHAASSATSRRAPARDRRARRLLRRVRGARQRRQVLAGRARLGPADAHRRRGRDPDRRRRHRRRRRAGRHRACAGSATASRRSPGGSTSPARPGAGTVVTAELPVV